MITTYLIIAVVVFGINVIPFFMPATWTVLSLIAINYNVPLLPLAIVGAIFATLGRLVLAILSQTILRGKILNQKTKDNVDEIRKQLEKRQALTFALILFYAFSPFASNQLFIAYGMTKMKLRLIAIPFFIGRLVSYTAFTFTTSALAKKFMPTLGSYFTGYFILAQIVTIGILYLFTKINWHDLITKKRIGLIDHKKTSSK